MGELVVDMFMTLDGVIQAPGGRDEDRESGFEHGGWQGPFFDEASGEIMSEHISHVEALLLGRKTYEIFASYWPTASVDEPIATQLNRVPKLVASRTLTTVQWNNSHLIHGDVPEQVARLKQEHGEIHTIGSADLVHTLMEHGLIDRYNLWLYPVILGTGKRMFVDGALPTALRLVESRTLSKGALWLVYEPTGRPTYSEMG